MLRCHHDNRDPRCSNNQGHGRQTDRVFLIDYGLACIAGDGSASSTAEKAPPPSSTSSLPTVWVEVSKQDQAAAAAAAALAATPMRAPHAVDATAGAAAAPIGSGGDGTEKLMAATAADVERPRGGSSSAPTATANGEREAYPFLTENKQSVESAETSQQQKSTTSHVAPFGTKAGVVLQGGTAMVEDGEGGGGGGGEVGKCPNGLGDGNSAQLPAQLPTETVKLTTGPTGLVGSVRYLSVDAHEGGRQTRRCDLESLAYVLIYLVRVSGENAWRPASDGGNPREHARRRRGRKKGGGWGFVKMFAHLCDVQVLYVDLMAICTPSRRVVYWAMYKSGLFCGNGMIFFFVCACRLPFCLVVCF